jgi:hypothetical protein
MCNIYSVSYFTSRVESQLSGLNETNGWSDNQKWQIIWKTNEKDMSKNNFSLHLLYDIIKL